MDRPEELFKNPSGKIHHLMGNFLAMEFKGHQVLPATIAKHMLLYKAGWHRLAFFPESPISAGKKRMNSPFSRKQSLEAHEIAEQKGLDLRKHILIYYKGPVDETLEIEGDLKAPDPSEIGKLINDSVAYRPEKLNRRRKRKLLKGKMDKDKRFKFR